MRTARKIIVLLAVLISGGASRARAVVYVTGRATAQETGAALVNATVALYEPDNTQPAALCQTLVNGSFILKAPGPGRYKLLVFRPGAARGVPGGGLAQWLDIGPAGTAGLALVVPADGGAVSPANLLPILSLKLRTAAGQPPDAGLYQVVLILSTQMDAIQRCYVYACVQPVKGDGALDLTLPRAFAARRIAVVGVSVRSADSGLQGTVITKQWPDAPLPMTVRKGAPLTGSLTAADGKPLAGVSILATGLALDAPHRVLQGWETAVTDQTGRFRMYGLPPGRYDLEWIRPGAPPRRFPVTVGPQGAFAPLSSSDSSGFNSNLLSFIQPLPEPQVAAPLALRPVRVLADELSPAPAVGIPVLGHVRNPETGAPIAGATVGVYGEHTIMIEDMTRTDETGAFALQVAEPGKHRMALTGPVIGSSRYMQVPAEGLKDVELPVTSHPYLHLQLTGPDGKRFTTGLVQLWLKLNLNGKAIQSPMELAAPRLGVLNVRPPSEAKPDASDITDVTVDMRVPEVGCAVIHLHGWPQTPLPVSLQPGCTLSGAVTRGTGRPAAGVTVYLYRLERNGDGAWEEDRRWIAHEVTRAAGQFKFTALTDGTYDMRTRIQKGVTVSHAAVVRLPEVEAVITPADPPTASVIPVRDEAHDQAGNLVPQK